VQSPRLGPRDVEIEVEAAALNFRDVLKALGMYPSEPGAPFWLGDECSGVVRRVGREVTEFVPGDRVIAIGPGSFGSRVTVLSDYVVHMPDGLTFEQAAAIPIVWLTTHYALNHLSNLAANERILIHSAAGGVGLAAIQFAQLAGAEIFATAGSKRKRAYLRSLGVKHVYDSRSLEFADRIRSATNGEGIDVVLNSLAGDYIPTSMSLLRPMGRFVELGKIDLYQNSKLGLWPFRNGLSFTAVDMSWLMEHQPARCKTLLQEIVSGFEAGRLKPLPVEVFSLADAEGAFRMMAQAKHIGKIVLNVKEAAPPPAAAQRARSLFRRNASYLITGGLGGVGLELAEWLVDQGARNLVLAGRSGVSSPQAELTVARLKQRGARVDVVKADVVREADVAELMQFIDTTLPPLRGVFHAAMVLDDALLLQLNDRRFLRVVEPKAYGAWNLHQHTKSLQLDHFVLFSSLASFVGNVGQANYSAANAFLDGLAHYRRALGLPGLVVNWGPIGEVGFVARNPEIARQLERMGFVGYKPADALALLKQFLEDGDTQTAAIRLNFRNFSGYFSSESVNRRFSHVFGLLAAEGLGESKRSQGSNSAPDPEASDVWTRMMTLAPGNNAASMLQSIAAQMSDSDTGSSSRLKSAASTILAIPEEERLGALTDVLKQQFAAVTGIAVERLDGQQPITSYNLDSLMRLELLLRVEQQLGVRLEDDALGEGMSFAHLAGDILLRLTDPQEPVEVVTAAASRLP
jgi:NADPH:quinone reductase-like Zn-dependent oxidoreductase/acyl carrier protein